MIDRFFHDGRKGFKMIQLAGMRKLKVFQRWTCL